MALTTVSLVPILYDISNELENMQKLNGDLIVYNDPDKLTSNSIHLLQMGDKLLRYNTMKEQLRYQEKENNRLLVFYFVLTLITTVLVFGILGYVYGYKVYDMLMSTVPMSTVCILLQLIPLIIIILIFVLIIYTLVNVYTRNKSIYDKLYDIENSIESSNDAITKVKNMFITSDPLNATTIRVNSNHPLLVYNFQNARNTMKIKFQPFLDGNEQISKDCGTKMRSMDSSTFVKECIPPSHNGYMYPFIPSKPINPVVLRKEVQKLDLYGQISKINEAINWFRGFMLKKTDAVYGSNNNTQILSLEERAIIVNKIIDLLTKQLTLVYDISINEKVAQKSMVEKVDCYKTCFNDKDCLAVSYDPVTKTALTVKRGTQNAFKYNPDNKNPVLIKTLDPENEMITVLSDVINNDYITTNFNSNIKGDNILKPLVESTWFKEQGTSKSGVTHTDVFSGGSRAPVNVKHTFKISNIIEKNNSTLDVLLNNFKNEIADTIVNIIIYNDPSNTFMFQQSELNKIAKEVEKVNRMSNIVVSDIMIDIPTRLQKKYTELKEQNIKNNQGKAKFIPFKRFNDKMNELSSLDFVMHFVYYSDILRSCSDGLKKLYDKFDYTADLDRKKTELSNVGLSFYLTIGLAGWSLYALHDYNKNIECKSIRPQYVTTNKQQKDLINQDNPLYEFKQNTNQNKEDLAKSNTEKKELNIDNIESTAENKTESKSGFFDSLKKTANIFKTSTNSLKNLFKKKEINEEDILNETIRNAYAKYLESEKTNSFKDEYKLVIKTVINDLSKAKDLDSEKQKELDQAKDLLKDLSDRPLFDKLSGFFKSKFQTKRKFIEKGKQLVSNSEGIELITKLEVLLDKQDEKINVEEVNSLYDKFKQNIYDQAWSSYNSNNLSMIKFAIDVKEDELKEHQEILGQLFNNLQTTTKNEINKSDEKLNIESEIKIQDQQIILDLIEIKELKTKIEIIEAQKDINKATKELKDEVKKGGAPQTKERLKEIEETTRKVDNIVSTALKHIVIVFIIIISYLVLQSSNRKHQTIVNYNRNMIETNGTIILNNSRNIMQILYADLAKNRYNIKSIQTNTQLAPFIKNGIHINTAESKDYDSTGITEEQFFDIIAKNSVISEANTIRVDERAQTEEIYNLMVQLIDAYEKCNTIANSETPTMPFPILQIVMYIVLLFACVIVVLFILGTFKPFHRIMSHIFFMRVQNRGRKGELAVIDMQTEAENNPDDPTNIQAMLYIKIISTILIIMFGVLFAVTIEDNTNSFISALYGGDHFRNNQCYS